MSLHKHDAEWENFQIQKVAEWINQIRKPESKQLKDIPNDLKDGKILVELVEVLSGTKLRGIAEPKSRILAISNTKVALSAIEKNFKVKLPGVGPEDIVDGKMKMVMGTLWGLMRHCASIEESDSNNSVAFSAAKKLHTEILNGQKKKINNSLDKPKNALVNIPSLSDVVHDEEVKEKKKEDDDTASEGDEYDPEEHIGGADEIEDKHLSIQDSTERVAHSIESEEPTSVETNDAQVSMKENQSFEVVIKEEKQEENYEVKTSVMKIEDPTPQPEENIEVVAVIKEPEIEKSTSASEETPTTSSVTLESKLEHSISESDSSSLNKLENTENEISTSNTTISTPIIEENTKVQITVEESTTTEQVTIKLEETVIIEKVQIQIEEATTTEKVQIESENQVSTSTVEVNNEETKSSLASQSIESISQEETPTTQTPDTDAQIAPIPTDNIDSEYEADSKDDEAHMQEPLSSDEENSESDPEEENSIPNNNENNKIDEITGFKVEETFSTINDLTETPVEKTNSNEEEKQPQIIESKKEVEETAPIVPVTNTIVVQDEEEKKRKALEDRKRKYEEEAQLAQSAAAAKVALEAAKAEDARRKAAKANEAQKQDTIMSLHSVLDDQLGKQILNIPSSPYLYYVDPESGKTIRYKIQSETINIGRKHSNDLILESKFISRFHCRIDVEQKDGEFICSLHDLESSGCRINGERITEKVLVKGDQIKLGKTVLLFLDKSDRSFISKPKKEGQGEKQSGGIIKNWQKRYFVLQGHMLYYWKTKKDRQNNSLPHGMIDIDSCLVDSSEKNTIYIEAVKKTYNLRYSNPEEKDEWLDLLKKVSGRKR